MEIVNFTASLIIRAAQIARQNYEEERGFTPALPAVNMIPDLTGFAAENLGVAAVDGDELLGYFCWHAPWKNHFGLSKGTWSPLHAHGAVRQNRGMIYDRLYQAASEKLVRDAVLSHSVTLYEHDEEAVSCFFQNGFGKRCADAIRETTRITSPTPPKGVIFRQAGSEDADAIARMNNGLAEHLRHAPMFMAYEKTFTAASIADGITSGDYQYFIALENDRPSAYIRIQKSGENFAADDSSVMNISGAYALPGVRGKGVSAGLLSWLTDWLRENGYSRCGVDFESFNYTARRFWLKYFSAYTCSLSRRIDERIVQVV